MPQIPQGPFTPSHRGEFFAGAECIWKLELSQSYNCHLAFRKSFTCEYELFAGELRISASDTYRLFINGAAVGEGPARSERGQCYADLYDVSLLPFTPGENIITVLALNKNLAEHGQPPKNGALIASLLAHDIRGNTVKVLTGPDWKVSVADWYVTPAPRRFFPVGFNEHVDFRRVQHDILAFNYPDDDWELADVVGDTHMAQCLKRPIPPYKQNHIFPKRILRYGKLGEQSGIMGVALSQTQPFDAQHAQFRTWVYAEKDVAEAYLYFGCDNYSRVLLNGDEIWTQGEPDHGFIHHLSHYEAATYEGMIHGQGLRYEPNTSCRERAACQLNTGWNELIVEVNFLNHGYGFELVFCDSKTDLPLPLICSAEQNAKTQHGWHWREKDTEIWQPLPTDLPDHRPWLSPSHLAAWDQRMSTTANESIESLFRLGVDEEVAVLQPGEFIELELETYAIGYLKLQLTGPAGSIIDFAIAERDDADSDRLPFLNNGLWLAERIVLSGDENFYTGLERRGGRFLYLCVRQADGPVAINSVMIRNIRYGNSRAGEFTCSDPILNWMWKAGTLTTELATFDLSEDCPTREMAQWSGDSYLRMFLLAGLWGDMRISEKALREFAADQTNVRWGRAMVPAGYGDSIVDYALLLPIWSWEHYQLTGDNQFLPAVFSGVRNLLEFAATQVDIRGYLIPKDRHANQVYLDMKLVGVVRQLPLVTGLQAYYVKSLECAALLAELMEEPNLARNWRDTASKLRLQINHDLWAVDEALYVDGEDRDGNIAPTTRAATNYIMLWADIPEAPQRQAILRQLFPRDAKENLALWRNGEGVYLKHFMAEALLKNGHVKETLHAWRGFYGSMMKQLETIPEAWDRSWAEELPTGQGGTPSANGNPVSTASLRSMVHPFGISTIWHFIYYIGGIQPAKPGYREIFWVPMPGDLEFLNLRFPLPNSNEYLTLKMEPNSRGGRDLILTCPDNIPVHHDARWLNQRDSMQVTP
ncbi:MGH1-like glycoside hydrolase domain-containing protein [Cerasicoccus fimbriatus]|uniref:alpha-L-rhamnosidase-related protein n=1 Tax=Cerasicoccus fimbriatus TaxID=3014554 RepID=UPI0022B567F2|nr:hypothetical protein [Cerasicoccus sp. TK19100]